MAVLPNVMALGGARIPSATRPVAVISPNAASAVGDELTRVGATVEAAGFEIIDREATAAAKERDAQVADEIRGILYDPQKGFANLSGSAAVSQRQATLDRLDALKAKATEGLSIPAQKKLQDQLQRRLEGARNTIDTHTSGERKTWLETAGTARMESAFLDALTDPTQIGAQLGIITGELQGRAAREGWAPEVLALETQKATSRVYGGVVERLASQDPAKALAFLDRNREKMTEPEATRLRSIVAPMAAEAAGREIGARVYGASQGKLPSYDHKTLIEFNMGPARPNPPDKPVLDVIGKSIEDVLGPGAVMVVTSGREDDGNQHGSNRHRTGLAADVAIFRPDGTQVTAGDPEMAAIARAAAKNGALGIGFGAEYMGGAHIHIDLVEPGEGQANFWASGAKAIGGDLVALMAGRGPMDLSDIADIPDPDIRKAAIDEVNLRSAIAAKDRQEFERQVTDKLFQIIEAGGSVNDLSVEEKAGLSGAIMQEARRYERDVKSGIPTETDDQFYVDLRRVMDDRPDLFLQANPMIWRNRLNTSDFKWFVAAQSEMRTAPAPKRPGAPAVSTMMEEASRYLKASGLDDTDEAAFQTAIVRWADANPDLAANMSQRNLAIRGFLAEVVLDPPGWRNERSGRVFQIDFEGDPLDPNDDVSIDDIINGKLRINKKRVEYREIAGFATRFIALYGRDPTPQELVEGLAASGLYK